MSPEEFISLLHQQTGDKKFHEIKQAEITLNGHNIIIYEVSGNEKRTFRIKDKKQDDDQYELYQIKNIIVLSHDFDLDTWYKLKPLLATF